MANKIFRPYLKISFLAEHFYIILRENLHHFLLNSS